MAQTASKIDVHCPACGLPVNVPVQIAAVQRGDGVVAVMFDPTTVAHVCRVAPYVGRRSRGDNGGQVNGL